MEVSLVKEVALELFPEILEIRRHLHAHPELSFEEKETSAFVSKKLTEWQIPFTAGVGGYGVVGFLGDKSKEKGAVALRADMDALPILEQNDIPYKSKTPGVMHACGHDVHTSCLLGAAAILKKFEKELDRPIKLVFQPGEEKAPGGASIMIQEGVLENPPVASMIGQHVAPFLPVGKIGFREGMYMASTDEIHLKIIGKGGHGAAPDQCIDPIAISATLITSLQQIISRYRKPTNPSVLTFGKIVGDGATNVIPGVVYLEGTFRNMDEEWREKGLQLIEKMSQEIVSAFGAKLDFYIERGYPFLQNNPALTRKLRKNAENYVGKENVVDLDLWMGGEDFAYYSQRVPSTFYRLGTRNEDKNITSGVHTPTFNIDEAALEIGAGLMAWNAFMESRTI